MPSDPLMVPRDALKVGRDSGIYSGAKTGFPRRGIALFATRASSKARYLVV